MRCASARGTTSRRSFSLRPTCSDKLAQARMHARESLRFARNACRAIEDDKGGAHEAENRDHGRARDFARPAYRSRTDPCAIQGYQRRSAEEGLRNGEKEAGRQPVQGRARPHAGEEIRSLAEYALTASALSARRHQAEIISCRGSRCRTFPVRRPPSCPSASCSSQPSAFSFPYCCALVPSP